MADILNIPNSGSTGTGNSGVDSNDLKAETLKGIILTDPDFVIAAADRADLDTLIGVLQDAAVAARGDRIFPIHDLVNIEDQSSDPTQGGLGNLTPVQIDLAPGVPAFLLGHYNGEGYHKKLSRFNSQSLRIFFYDQNYTLFGTVDSDGNLKGYTMSQFQTRIRKFGTSSESAKYPFRVVLQSESEFKDNSGYVAMDSRLAQINGIIDVVLSVYNHTTNVVKIKGLTETAGQNFIEQFNAELDAAGAWDVTKDSDGTAFTVTSYVYDSTNKVMTITLDSTAYTALTSLSKINIDLKASAALAALGVSPYESTGSVQITKP